MKNLNSIVHFKYPTIYELIMTVGMFMILISLFQMQKDYITKDYIYDFYITKDQILTIEEARPSYLKRVNKGEDFDKVNKEFNSFTNRILSLRSRGGL
jgi:hypothetical protein